MVFESQSFFEIFISKANIGEKEEWIRFYILGFVNPLGKYISVNSFSYLKNL
jgi:hypothetical protein